MRTLSPRAVESRAARARRTDQLVLDAAVGVAADDGWPGLTHLRVAARAGVSRGPLQDRYVDHSALLADLWRRRLAGPTVAALEALLRAAGLDETATPDETALVHAITACAAPDRTLQAAAELLVVAAFDAELRTAISETLGSTVRSWCTTGPAGPGRTLAARRAYLLDLGLGLLLIGRLPGGEGVDYRLEATKLLRRFASEVAPRRLPATRADHFEAAIAFAPDDPEHDAILNSAMREFGRDGYEGASLGRIARAAGVSLGILRGRYPTKLELFMDTLRRQVAAGLEANERFMNGLETRHGRGIAEAVMLREWLAPEPARARALMSENLRLAAHVAAIGDAWAAEHDRFVEQELAEQPDWPVGPTRASVRVSLALGTGICILPLLAPELWTLPFDVVTVPSHDAEIEAAMSDRRSASTTT